MQNSTKGRRNQDVISKVKMFFMVYIDFFFMTDYFLFLNRKLVKICIICKYVFKLFV